MDYITWTYFFRRLVMNPRLEKPLLTSLCLPICTNYWATLTTSSKQYCVLLSNICSEDSNHVTACMWTTLILFSNLYCLSTTKNRVLGRELGREQRKTDLGQVLVLKTPDENIPWVNSWYQDWVVNSLPNDCRKKRRKKRKNIFTSLNMHSIRLVKIKIEVYELLGFSSEKKLWIKMFIKYTFPNIEAFFHNSISMHA